MNWRVLFDNLLKSFSTEKKFNLVFAASHNKVLIFMSFHFPIPLSARWNWMDGRACGLTGRRTGALATK